MKKLVYASVLAGLCLAATSQIMAQDKIEIKDPAEFNAYQAAMNATDPRGQASAIEAFLTAYPQSVVKKMVLSQLVDSYQQAGDPANELSAAGRLLQVDPNNLKAVFVSVGLKKSQCARTSDAQVCDDMGALAQKGLTLPKPAETTDPDWKTQTSAAYPAFHSAIALDMLLSKKDVKGAIAEYRTELTLYPLDATTKPGPALVDTLQLAEAYARPEARDMVLAVWFYARAWNYAPPAFKAQIEPKMEYWYKRYHGKMDGGLDDIKAAAAKDLFKPDAVTIKPAPTPAEIAHDAVASGADKLGLEDREYVLANGSKEDVDTVWNLMKGQVTPIPGVVIEASPTVIKLAVTQDAKDAKEADFIVNLKTPLADKDVPAAGTEYKLLSQNADELDGTIDSFTPVAATATRAATAQIVANDAFIQEYKKPKTPAHKPSAAHHKAQ